MEWLDVIAWGIVGLAGLYIAYRVRRALTRRSGCGCGTSGCAAKSSEQRGIVTRELVQLGSSAQQNPSRK